ncbi:MAG: nuclear transport factor 2 family protein [Candidatus Eremiobacteraeota bacterium]|nr:nuclear transport factor 2 family protein [Candidatus Eremiobacteraeota bacterium]
MKVLFALAAIALLATNLSLSARADTSSGARAEVAALYDRFAEAFRNKDLNGVMSLYVHNDSLFAFDVSPPREYVGWNAYRDDWKSLFASFRGPIHFAIVDLAIVASGDVAYTHSLQRVSGTSPDGKLQHLVVRVTDVLRKFDGKWLIVQEHASVPVDADSGVADWDSK